MFSRHPRRRAKRTAPSRLRTAALVSGASVGAVVSSALPTRADGLSAIRLTADRTLLTSDGRSQTNLYAQVFDAQGRVVADGTRVRFSVSGSARLDTSVAATRNGVAQVTLTAADQPGYTVVSAFLETGGQAVPTRLLITFSRDADNADVGANWARVNGSSYVGYAADRGILQANGKNGGASLSFRAVNVRADVLQFDTRENQIQATGNVTLAIGEEKQTFSHLALNLISLDGIGERTEEEKPVHIRLHGPTATPEVLPTNQAPPTPYPSTWTQAWTLQDLSDAAVTVVARSVQVEPNVRLQFRRATFYVDGKKTVTLPFHVMSLGQQTVFDEQVIGLSPQGITVDFPLYYDVRPEAVGTLRVRRNARVGNSAYSQRIGWSFDAVQAYNGPRSTVGQVELTGLSRPDWGLAMRHAQRLGNNVSGNASVQFPNHRDILFGSNVTRRYNLFNLNLTGSGSRYSGVLDPLTLERGKSSGDFRGLAIVETHDKPIGKLPVRYTLNMGLARQAFFGDGAVTQGSFNQQTLGTRAYTAPLSLGSGYSFTQSASTGFAWIQGTRGIGQRGGLNLLGTSTVSRPLSRFGTASLSYNYTQSPAIVGTSALLANGKHRMDFQTNASGGALWNVSLTASRALDVPQANLFGQADFRLFGPVRGRVSHQMSQFSSFHFQETEYGLGYQIGGRNFGMYYSTTSRRVQFDFSGARF